MRGLALLLSIAVAAPAFADPLTLGHRGTGVNTGSNPFPENTLASFIQAVEKEKADGIELDVQVALVDGNADPFDELVVMHDESLNRTTTCRSPAPLDDCVARRTSDEIRESCIPVVDGTDQPSSEIVPTLREALDAIIRDRAKIVNIEIKNQPPTDPDSQRELCNSGEPLNVSSLLTDLLVAEYTAVERARVIISSFNPMATIAAEHESRALFPLAADPSPLAAGVDTGHLVIPLGSFGFPDPRYALYAVALAKGAGLDAVHPSFTETDAALVDLAHAEPRIAVRPYTVNTTAEMDRLIGLGVDAIITDVPCVLAQKLGNASAECP